MSIAALREVSSSCCGQSMHSCPRSIPSDGRFTGLTGYVLVFKIIIIIIVHHTHVNCVHHPFSILPTRIAFPLLAEGTHGNSTVAASVGGGAFFTNPCMTVFTTTLHGSTFLAHPPFTSFAFPIHGRRCLANRCIIARFFHTLGAIGGPPTGNASFNVGALVAKHLSAIRTRPD